MAPMLEAEKTCQKEVYGCIHILHSKLTMKSRYFDLPEIQAIQYFEERLRCGPKQRETMCCFSNATHLCR